MHPHAFASLALSATQWPLAVNPPVSFWLFSIDLFTIFTTSLWFTEEVERVDACMPSPCGENSQCRTKNNGHAICSCLPDFIGTPPNCRPECVHNAMCPQNRACARQKCVDPCPNTCGANARCQVVNHNPICSCAAGFTGDPFNACSKIICECQGKIYDKFTKHYCLFTILDNDPPVEESHPCHPSPCGPNAVCKVNGDQAACTCLPNYIGRAPNCRPECKADAECANNQACVNLQCVDPCPGSCGVNARCRVVNHFAVCTCNPGYEGNANSQCNAIAITQRKFVQVHSFFYKYTLY